MVKNGQVQYLTMNSRHFLLAITHFDKAAIFWTQLDHPDQCAKVLLQLLFRCFQSAVRKHSHGILQCSTLLKVKKVQTKNQKSSISNYYFKKIKCFVVGFTSDM